MLPSAGVASRVRPYISHSSTPLVSWLFPFHHDTILAMVSARRLQAGVHAALIGLAVPYVWLNIGLCAFPVPTARL